MWFIRQAWHRDTSNWHDMGLCEKHISVEMKECVCFYSTCVEKVLSDEHSWIPSSERTLRESPEYAKINNTFFYLSAGRHSKLQYFPFSLLFLSVCFPISCPYLSSPACSSLAQPKWNKSLLTFWALILRITVHYWQWCQITTLHSSVFFITLCAMWYYISVKYIVSICTLSELQE